MKYALIRRNRHVWPIRVQCRMLGVSVAGYHEHLVRRLQIARRRHLSTEALLVHIRAVYAANRGAYGWPRIWRELHAQDIRVGKQRVQRLMQQHGIGAGAEHAVIGHRVAQDQRRDRDHRREADAVGENAAVEAVAQDQLVVGERERLHHRAQRIVDAPGDPRRWPSAGAATRRPAK